jgi:quercetin dioxygenase-like cupin family protein
MEKNAMSIRTSKSQAGWLKISTAGVLAGAMAMVSATAIAGQCPKDKVGVDLTKPGATAPKGVTDNVLASIDLAKTKAGPEGQLFRMRRLVVEPGGVVPWHNHGERPALIYVIEGSITEYRSTCAVPIEHMAGEVTAEFGADLSHWWKNNTGTAAVLLSADLFHDTAKEDHPM